MVKNLPASAGDLGSIPMSGRSLRRKWQPTQVFLPGKSHGQRSLAVHSPQGHKESDMTERTHKHYRCSFRILTVKLQDIRNAFILK